MSDKRIYPHLLFIDEVVSAGGNSRSQPINLKQTYKPEGYFFLFVTISGSGVIKPTVVGYETGYEANEIEADIVDETDTVVEGLTAGNHGITIKLPLWENMDIKFNETGTTDSATITAKLNIQ